MLLLILLFSVATGDVLHDLFGSTQDVVNKMDSCVKKLRNSQSLHESWRFSDAQIAGFCAKQKMWREQVHRAQRRQSDGAVSEFTNKQLEWMTKIQRCSDLPSCLERATHSRKPRIDFLRDTPAIREKRQKTRPIPLSVRKEIRRMTDAERRSFFATIEQLKFDKIDNRSKYDMLTLYHRPESAPGAHWGPGFLGWHRELLRELEVALKQFNPSVSLPYWDSTMDEPLPDPTHSILFTDSFIGDDRVKPFRHWTTYYPVGGQYKIKRELGMTEFGFLFKPSDIQKIMNFTQFGQLTMCIDPYFELVHGGPHNWVGGHMADIPISPDDPSFYLHHTFVDYIWEQFRQGKQNDQQRKSDYPAQTNACNPNHYRDAPMLPYPKRNRDGISSLYTDEFYLYEPPPTCRRGKPQNCNSPYLFCHLDTERCLSKVIPGGNCTGFEGTEICYESRCIQGLCRSNPAVGSRPTSPPTSGIVDSRSKVQPREEGRTNFKPVPIAGSSNTTKTTCDCRCPANGERSLHADRPPSKLVYFPITIFSGIRKDIRFVVPEAEILTIGEESIGVIEGTNIRLNPGYPNFAGNAIAAAPNPFYHKGFVDIFLSVGTNNLTCEPQCYGGKDIGYAPCSGKVSLDRHGLRRPSFHVTEYEQQALYLAWEDHKRVPTPLMFLCNPKKPSKSRDRHKCKFQRFVGFELQTPKIRHIRRDNNVRSIEACKTSCKQTHGCKSAMFYPLQERCILNSLDRLRYMDEFRYNANEDVIYLDYRCDFERAFEE